MQVNKKYMSIATAAYLEISISKDRMIVNRILKHQSNGTSD